MEFTIKKYLSNGKFFVQPILAKLDEKDDVNFKKFGEPKLKIKFPDGVEREVEITKLARFDEFGFFLQEDAENYLKTLKERILSIKELYANKTDDWTSEEIV